MRFSIRKSISSHSLFYNYLFAFLLGFGALLIVYLPAMCLEHGYFLYYGDYNSQQLPCKLHRVICLLSPRQSVLLDYHDSAPQLDALCSSGTALCEAWHCSHDGLRLYSAICP